MRGRNIFVIISMAFLWALLNPFVCHAEIASDTAFENAVWEKVAEYPRQSPVGVVQSMCVTEDYIICMENYDDATDDPDIISAYYRNNVDENGNPVVQYSLVKHVAERDYEHANGMAYNPNTGEILVSLYTSKHEENRGCLFVMDAKTLTYKDKIKISDSYNILGIGYNEETNQYVIQTNVEGGYSFKILDENFQIIEDLGEYAGTAKGDNFQDLCVSGDYIINFPLTLNMGIGDYINQYSISRRTLVSDPQLNFNFENVISDEPESICEVEPGVFLAAVNVTEGDGSLKLYLYKTTVPYNFEIATSVKGTNGKISDGSVSVLRGESFPVRFSPDESYKLSSLTIDNNPVDITDDQTVYTFENVQASHTIEVAFTELSFGERVAGFFERKDSESEKGNALTPLAAKVAALVSIVVLLFCSFAIYLRVLYVRRIRLLKRKQARRERARIMREYEERTAYY